MESQEETMKLIEPGISYDPHSYLAGEVSKAPATFFKYIVALGLVRDKNLLVLPSTHHYYYDEEELKNVSILINIKQLNDIGNIRDFIRSVIKTLPKNSNFIGRFKESSNLFSRKRTNTTQEISDRHFDNIENGISSKHPFINMLFKFMDAKTNNYLSRHIVRDLLYDNGFAVLDFTEFDGLTYFHAVCRQNKAS